MAILVKLSLASLVAGWIALAAGLPRQIPETQQQATPPPLTDVGKHLNPDASGKYHVGDGVSNPKLIYQVMPEFSEKLLRKKVHGECTVSITVDTNGNPQDVHIIKSVPDNNDKKLRDAVIDMQNKCIEAAKQFRFEPSLYKGKPVPVEQTIETIFPFFN